MELKDELGRHTPHPKALRRLNDGPILALPDTLAVAADISHDTELQHAAQAACDALARYAVGGGPLPADDDSIFRLDSAVAAVAKRAESAESALRNHRYLLYDAVFEVRRTADVHAGLVHGLLIGTRSILRQLSQHNRLMPFARTSLVSGMASTLCSLFPTITYQPRFVAWPNMEPMPQYSAIDRWVEGHYALFCTCQAIVYFLSRMNDAKRAGDAPAARAMLSAVTNGFQTVGHAFSLAGDITPAEYDPGIVNLMLEADSKFTGLWFADHAKAKSLATVLKAACPANLDHNAFAKFIVEFNFASESHKYVCTEVTGGERASLMQQADGEEESATKKLQRINVSNMKAIKAVLE
jgi:hypothetical protein